MEGGRGQTTAWQRQDTRGREMSVEGTEDKISQGWKGRDREGKG